METIRPSFEILTPLDRSVLGLLELAGRTCYKSEGRITEGSASKFVEMVCTRNHESVIEHASVSVRFICDRGVTHELVRHRIGSFSQESTRYVNYQKRGIQFVLPPWVKDQPEGNGARDLPWFMAMRTAETIYNHLLDSGWKPEQARAVLPNSLKTEIVATFNLRQWRHVFRLRTSKQAHPQMRELMIPLAKLFAKELPEIYGEFASLEDFQYTH